MPSADFYILRPGHSWNRTGQFNSGQNFKGNRWDCPRSLLYLGVRKTTTMAYNPQRSEHIQKYPSLTSVNTMASLAMMPGHGYVPKKEKPEKPYGLTFQTVLNRTHRGPGRKHLRYALAFGIAAVVLFSSAALYFGHRNVSRMIVYRSEVGGAMLVVSALVCVSLMGKCLLQAREESNKWRQGIRVSSHYCLQRYRKTG